MKKFLSVVLLAVFAFELSGCEAMQRVIDRQTARELAAAEAQKPKPETPSPQYAAFLKSMSVVNHGPCKDCIFSRSYNDPQPKRYSITYNGKTIRCREFPTGSDRYLCN